MKTGVRIYEVEARRFLTALEAKHRFGSIDSGLKRWVDSAIVRPGSMIELQGEGGGLFISVTTDHRCMTFLPEEMLPQYEEDVRKGIEEFNRELDAERSELLSLREELRERG
jgi:hypothetical protein